MWLVATSDDHTTFTAGTITTTGGVPTPTLSLTGDTLPHCVSFTDHGDGTATLAGSAAVGGVYQLTITASNGVTIDAEQGFTLTVNGPPSITSPDSADFIAGVTSSFDVTARDGVPAGVTLTETGDLPPGVTFQANPAIRPTAASASRSPRPPPPTATRSSRVASG